MEKKKKFYKKSERRNGVLRFMLTMLAIFIQVTWLGIAFFLLNDYYSWIALSTKVLSIILVLVICGKRTNYSVKLPWIILILITPILGILLYAMVYFTEKNSGMRKRYNTVNNMKPILLPDAETELNRISRKNPAVANMFRYVYRNAGYPVYSNSDIEFYPQTDLALEAQLDALSKAKKFIFMEYFSIEDSVCFSRYKEILKQKVTEGVKVRILYDDVGSMKFIDMNFVREMQELGIECVCFNPMIPVFHVFMNHRDHRKICVIDGEVAFTGGYNLADEYFNVTHPYGHWKDTGIKITGDAVCSMTMIFLETWNAILLKKDKKVDDMALYLTKPAHFSTEDGFVQPYADSPLDELHLGEDVYLNIINAATNYVYITTPYLLIMDEMRKALILAAERGVDVRLITPGIPDKKITYMCTRSYYHDLVKHGVRIYEYTPGFIHAKQIVSDDKIASVGTINLDFRSLYHHFENGVMFFNLKAVKSVRKDFDKTFPLCREVSEKYKAHMTIIFRMFNGILKLFTPML